MSLEEGVTTAVPLKGGAPVRLITCHANRGKTYRVQADQHGNFLSVEVYVNVRPEVEYFRTIWTTNGGKDPSTTACCAMRAARRVLDSASTNHHS